MFDEQKCRICGCTQNNACEGGCYWIEDDFCSQCDEKMKPILFNTEMVQAILDGRKIVTRRVIKTQYPIFDGLITDTTGSKHTIGKVRFSDGKCEGNNDYIKLPYQKRDILYVRETWLMQSMRNFDKTAKILFKAIPNEILSIFKFSDERYEKFIKFFHKNGWKSPYFMPKEAARIFLKVTDVRVERLQDITEEQAIKEGIKPHEFQEGMLNEDGTHKISGLKIYDYHDNSGTTNSAIKAFFHLWNSTIEKQDLDKYGWNANPFVWVYEFEILRIKNGMQ
jgi:hypothetical protein